jgi:hypothetical protein
MKHSKSAVSYTKVGSEKEHCSICQHFERPNKCELVSGDIAPGGWCKLWKGQSMPRGRDYPDDWTHEPAKKRTRIGSRRPSAAVSESARARFGSRKGKFNLGFVGPKEKNNPLPKAAGAKGHNAIDQDQRPQFPEESEVKNRGAYSTSKRPSNVTYPPELSMANYYGGPSSRPGGGGSSTYYGGGRR